MNKIRVFSTPTCPYCQSLKLFLQKHNFEFEDIDISQDEAAKEEMIERTDQMGVPVIEIDGEMIMGFEKEKIVELLGIEED